MNNQVIVVRLEKLQWKLRQAHVLVWEMLDASGCGYAKQGHEQLSWWYH
jgi:hypothetical protein